MSHYTSARYSNAEKTEIAVLIDGVVSVVPAVQGNAAYGDMLREGVPIGDYEAPPKVDRAALKEEARLLLEQGKVIEAMEKLGLL